MCYNHPVCHTITFDQSQQQENPGMSNHRHSSVTPVGPNALQKLQHTMTFIKELSAALNNPTVIAAFGKIIADKVCEALKMEECEAMLAAKNNTIADLKSKLSETIQQNDTHDDILEDAFGILTLSPRNNTFNLNNNNVLYALKNDIMHNHNMYNNKNYILHTLVN